MGQLDNMALLQLGVEQVMALLGLGADSPATVLTQLRERALVRCATALQELQLLSKSWALDISVCGDFAGQASASRMLRTALRAERLRGLQKTMLPQMQSASFSPARAS